MKKLLFVSLWLISMTAMAQNQDLVKLSTGKIICFEPIYKKEKLDNFAFVEKVWGYCAIYLLDKLGKEKYKIKYVLMDKNLNKFASSEFSDYKMWASSTGSLPNYKIWLEDKTNNIIVCGSHSRTYQINIKDNTISHYIELDKKTVDLDQKNSVLNSSISRKYAKVGMKSHREERFDSLNYIIYNFNTNHKKIEYIESLSYYNTKDSSLIWTRPMNLKAEEKDNNAREIYYYTHLAENENMLIFFKTVRRNDIKIPLAGYGNLDHKTEGILCLNRKTGEILYNNDVFKDETIVFTKEEVGGQSIKGNKYIFAYQGINEDNQFEGYHFDLIDLNTGQILKKNHFEFKDAKADLNFKKNSNKLEGGFQLIQKDFRIHQDGRITLLCEKYKAEKGPLDFLGMIPIAGTIVAGAAHQQAKATDFVLFNFNDDFTLESTNTLKKELTKGYNSDFLFSQYIDNGNSSVLFYKDEIKEEKTNNKEWKLGIVTVKNSEVKSEEIPMTKKEKFVIIPVPAKEGYILLREYNEDEKYDQIRLEKLNY